MSCWSSLIWVVGCVFESVLISVVSSDKSIGKAVFVYSRLLSPPSLLLALQHRG